MRQPKREVVDDKVIERMLEIMQERRISQQELVDHLGLQLNGRKPVKGK